jgi:glucosamine--fructose-6-phosphate aminotransferase (isomerizing)
LIDSRYSGDPIAAIRSALAEVEGSYAIGVLFKDHPDTIYAARKDSPLIVGLDVDGNFIASDVPAILEYTRDYYLLEEGELAIIKPDSVQILDEDSTPIAKERLTANWDISQAQKSGFPHFMLKEIHEQPLALEETIRPRLKDGLPDFVEDGLPRNFFAQYKKFHFVACGTAMHAGTVGKSLIEKLARIPCEVDFASEFRYKDPILAADTLVVAISQSGETADTLAALRLAKSRGIDTLAIVNVTGSSIAREAAHVLHTYAGPEIAVASTKAFSVQVAMLYLVALETARTGGKMDANEAKQMTSNLLETIEKIPEVIALSDRLKNIAGSFVGTHSLFYMGRGVDYSLAMEGSLKLKEISYIHSEAYAAGELKHGTISLITDGTPVIALATQSNLLAKTVSNIKEVRSRGGYVLLIAKDGFAIDSDLCDESVFLPQVDETFLPLLAVIVLQLIAYHVAVARGCDVDKPRNLAKSVTVE